MVTELGGGQEPQPLQVTTCTDNSILEDKSSQEESKKQRLIGSVHFWYHETPSVSLILTLYRD